MAKSDKGLLFFYDWREPFNELSGDDCKSLLMAMLDYSQNGTQPPEFQGSAKIAAAFIFPALDRSKMRAEVGRIGGRSTALLQANVKQTSSKASSKASSKCQAQDKDKDKDINNTIDSADAPKTAKAVKHKHGEYGNVLLTDEEFEKLKNEYSDYAERIERLSEYIASKGVSYKSHYATIRNWAKKDKSQISTAPTAERPLFPDYSDTERYKNLKV